MKIERNHEYLSMKSEKIRIDYNQNENKLNRLLCRL